MWKIYKYTSQTTGKSYIGQTGCATLLERAGSAGKKYHDCPKFFNAIQKYGWTDFSAEILFGYNWKFIID